MRSLLEYTINFKLRDLVHFDVRHVFVYSPRGLHLFKTSKFIGSSQGLLVISKMLGISYRFNWFPANRHPIIGNFISFFNNSFQCFSMITTYYSWFSITGSAQARLQEDGEQVCCGKTSTTDVIVSRGGTCLRFLQNFVYLYYNIWRSLFTLSHLCIVNMWLGRGTCGIQIF